MGLVNVLKEDMDMKFFCSVLALVFIGKACVLTASASDLTYTPINPSFGGNAFNSAHLLGLANAQNLPKSKADEAAKAARNNSSSDRFLRMLQSRLYSSLASQVSAAIFGDDAQPTGTIKFDDQEVSWINTGTEVQLVVTNLDTGEVTEIIVPTIEQ